MHKKWLLFTILVLTILSIIIILLFTDKKQYNKMIISENNWNNIIDKRKISTSISIDNIKFNDYNLLIDEDNSIIYYSIVDVSNKYNPSVEYTLNNKDIKIAFNKEMSDDILEDNKELKVLLYDKVSYRIYTLVVTNYPILNINYKEEDTNKRKIDVDIYLFDNHIDAPSRVIKSDGKLKIIEEDKEYRFSLKKESLGHNVRDNHISLLGMPKQDEYLIKVTDITNEKEKYVQLFINNKYKGLCVFGYNEERRVDNFERNKENNG